MPLNLQNIGSTTARRALFVILLVASLALATVYAREGDGGPIHAAQDAVMGATGSVGMVSAGFGAATEATGDAVADATANPTTLNGLREQNEELRRLLSEAEEYRQEANRLQGLLNMKQKSGITGPVARIVGRSTNAWDRSITIDMGSEEGVAGGMTVMGANGVIGQVSHADAHMSTVRLLTDANSGAAVMIQSSRADGIVRGSISGLLYLEDLDEDVIPEVGDVVVTSGLGGSYERGLVVGTVVSVSKTVADSSGDVIVDPNGNVSMLEEVIVVFSAPDVEAAEKEKAQADAQKAAQEEARQQEGESEDFDMAGEEDAGEGDADYGVEGEEVGEGAEDGADAEAVEDTEAAEDATELPDEAAGVDA